MKKVILSAAALLALTIGANAQSTQDRSEDHVVINLSATQPNWIDLEPEVTPISYNVQTTGGNWSTLENGWEMGNVTMTLSATRKCQVTATATDLVRGSGGAGDRINNSRISLVVDNYSSSGGINPGTFTVSTASGLNFTSPTLNNMDGATTPKLLASNSTGCHNITFKSHVYLYKALGCTTSTYYADNIIGGSTPLTGNVDFLASLVNP